MDGKYLHIFLNIVAGMEPIVDDLFIFRFNISNFTSFKDICLK